MYVIAIDRFDVWHIVIGMVGNDKILCDCGEEILPGNHRVRVRATDVFPETNDMNYCIRCKEVNP